MAGTIVGGVTAVLLLLGVIARPERRAAPRPDKPMATRSAHVALKNVDASSEPTPAVRQPEPVAGKLLVYSGDHLVQRVVPGRREHRVHVSGLGREGLRYAIEEMTEPKLLVMNLR